MKLSIGADPELFIRRKKHYISGHVFGCGTKDSPQKTKNGFVQVDGLALEMNVRPATTVSEFVSNTEGVLRDLQEIVAKADISCVLVAKPSVFFGKNYIKSLPEEIAVLGCNPDFNAYTRAQNETPNSEVPFRTGSGHVHLGWTENEEVRSVKHFNFCCALARQLDYFLGLLSLTWDKDNTRRRLYGRAGAFRPKPYGMEYRVLSNAWMSSPSLMATVFSQAKKAFDGMGKPLEDRYPSAENFINEGSAEWLDNKALCAEIL